jgi:glycosyltransferase involved in cell wall biosynthesis
MNTLAIMWAYNEADIIGWTIRHLIRQGVTVHVMDNWSDDDTPEVIDTLARGWPDVVSWERWPPQGPVATVSWREMLDYTAHRAARARPAYTWMMHHDADEIRRSAVLGETLCDALERIGATGANAVDHVVEVYGPREGYDALRHDPEHYFTTRVPDHMDMRNGQVKCWQQLTSTPVFLSRSGGHHAEFPRQIVATERLILKHYPLRTAAQTARKLAERAARWDPAERAKGWHVQYDEMC